MVHRHRLRVAGGPTLFTLALALALEALEALTLTLTLTLTPTPTPIVLQEGCARLGLVTGRDLAQCVRAGYPRWVSLFVPDPKPNPDSKPKPKPNPNPKPTPNQVGLPLRVWSHGACRHWLRHPGGKGVSSRQ